ncbi:MAG: CBS domain-containing protein [Halodesulfurarchaeum sp.]
MVQLSVRDLLTRDFVGVSEGDSVRGAIELMREDGETGAVVMHGSEPVGTVSPSELLDCIVDGHDLQSTPVSEIMRREPPSIPSDSTISEAAIMLARSDDEFVLVENEDGFVGIIQARELATIARETSEYEEETILMENDAEMNRADSALDEYSNQSICEVCGSLSRDLVNVNGQLLCPDCRSI